MSEVCLFPTCKRHPEKNGYCIGHRMYAGMSIEKEKPAPIAKVGDKRKEENKKYDKISKELKKHHSTCQVKSPNCINSPVHIHHKKGRIGKLLTDPNHLIVACDPCNSYIEDNHAWAEEHGFKVTKHDKNYKRIK